MRGYLMIILIVLASACNLVGGKAKLGPIEFLSWMKENGKHFTHEKEIENFRFKWQVLPTSYKILSEFDDISHISKKSYQERDSAMGPYLFCNLTISPVDNQKTLLETSVSNPQDYGARLNYFLNYAQKDIFLLQGKDTLRCLMYHFENTYGLQKHNTINLMFDKPKAEGDIEFVFDEKVLNTGTIRFVQDNERLKTIPQLKLD